MAYQIDFINVGQEFTIRFLAFGPFRGECVSKLSFKLSNRCLDIQVTDDAGLNFGLKLVNFFLPICFSGLNLLLELSENVPLLRVEKIYEGFDGGILCIDLRSETFFQGCHFG